MSKLFEKFKKMPLLLKIATIAFLAALAALVFATLLGYIGDIFIFGLFGQMFAGVSGFVSVILYFVKTLLHVAFVAILLLAMLSGNRGRISFVILCKAVIMSASMFFITPLKRLLLVITNGFSASIISGGVIFAGFVSLIYMFALISVAILLLKGYGKYTKLAGFITGGVFAAITVVYCVDIISVIIGSIKDFIQGNAAGGVFGLLSDTVGYIAAICLAAGFIALCLSAALSAKGAFIPKKTVKE